MDTADVETRLRDANKLEALARFARGVAHDFNNLFRLGAVQPLESELVDLNDLVRASEKELATLVGSRIGVATALEPRFSPITADPRELKQALLNLVLNARDAMPDGGQITIETANVVLDEMYAADHRLMPPGQYALLAITDTGSGMDAAPRAHLFEPYFTTRDPGARTGLGLATVYGIVKRSGGVVGGESGPGPGGGGEVK